jgi:AraC-like DNA-binding protein/mannose-6-phosphate isomerase-like protein (cupin superfamily)
MEIIMEPICKFNDSKANAINCTQFVYETTDAQAHPVHATHHHVGIVWKGSGLLTLNGESATIGEGDIYFIRKGSVFSVNRSPNMEYCYISFHGWHADELMERLRISQTNYVFRDHGLLSDFWRSCFDRSESGNLDLFSEAVLLYTVANLADIKKETNELTDRIAEYANLNFSNSALNLSDIANELGYDAKYLSALFSAKRGITFTQYLRGVRIKHAAFLFEEGVESVKSVAILSGFSDALYFSKIFKQETGMTPSAYFQRRRDEKLNQS